MTPNEIKGLGEKEEWDKEIEHLIMLSRYWFEDEDELAARVASAKSQVKGSLPKGKSASMPAANGKAAIPGNVWATVGKPSAGRSSATRPKSGGQSSSKNAFAGLEDSDSD